MAIQKLDCEEINERQKNYDWREQKIGQKAIYT